MKKMLITVWLFAAGSCFAQNEIGFVERFALADDRAKALEELIPGTPAYYFYHALHHQQAGDRKAYDETMAAWIKRHGRNGQVQMMENRQALIDYGKQPRESLDHFVRRLGLSFDHRRQSEAEKAVYPTRLDPKEISVAAFRVLADKQQNTGQYTDEGLRSLAGRELNPGWRRHLLQRLTDPDFPGLAGLVAADLQEKNSGGFGSIGIHRMMTVKQLDGLAKARPELLNHGGYVNTYVDRLKPRTGVDLAGDAAAREAYLETLWAFVSPLAPVHNSLKAHVLYRRLVHDRDQGVYDAERFMSYIKLPRNVSYLNRDFANQADSKRWRANLGASFNTIFPPVGRDQQLVREYLGQFFIKAGGIQAYAPFIEESFLKDVFAETKITTGAGNPERWASMLSPARYQQIVERIDLDFLPTNKKYFAPTDPVRLDLHVKNAKSLIVKVFEINTFNYYREYGNELNIAVDLDGLVAADEKTYTYEDPPAKRVKRSFAFPQLKPRGVYVVDFIGNGKSSRALVIKGRLNYLETLSPAGHLLSVLDENNQRVKNATVWMGGREYTAEKNGGILLPFSTKPGAQSIILRHGEFCTLTAFHHQAETYQLHAGVHVDYESLLSGTTGKALIRPVLSASGRPCSLKLLEEVSLEITSTDGYGTDSKLELDGFKLFEDRESVARFFVPEQLNRLVFTLRAKVQNQSLNKKQDLVASRSFDINHLLKQQHISQLLFSRDGAGYFVDYRGRNGEAWEDQPLQVTVKHRWFQEQRNISLKTGADGRCLLGELPGIEWVRVNATGQGISQVLQPVQESLAFAGKLNAKAGEVVRIPVAPGLDNSGLSLIDEGFRSVENERLTLKGGFVEIAGLEPGRYQLIIRPQHRRHTIEISDGDRRYGHLLARTRLLEDTIAEPLQITGLQAGAKTVEIALANADPFTRVHVFASHYRPEIDPFASLSYSGWPEAREKGRVPPNSLYASGRNIGDEYRYILDRQFAKKYPGNMLDRPGLLLNPHSLGKTDEAAEVLALGDDFAAATPDAPKLAPPPPAPPALLRPGSGPGGGGGAFNGGSRKQADKAGAYRRGEGRPVQAGIQANLNFMQQPGLVFENLAPDDEGKVRLPRTALKGKHWLRVLVVHPRQAMARTLLLEERAPELLDDRLAESLDVKKAFTEQKLSAVIGKQKDFSVEDPGSSPFELYDSLSKVYGLFMALNPDEKLRKFDFVLDWPGLKPGEKREKYSRFACHELSFFLYHKDRPFFDAVIAPYLKNKKDQTFMDHWLLGADLERYLEPWHFNRLNIVERILLGERANRKDSLAAYVRDRFDLIPFNPEEYERRFDTAIKSQVLAVTGGEGRKLSERAPGADKDGDGVRINAGDANGNLPALGALFRQAGKEREGQTKPEKGLAGGGVPPGAPVDGAWYDRGGEAATMEKRRALNGRSANQRSEVAARQKKGKSGAKAESSASLNDALDEVAEVVIEDLEELDVEEQLERDGKENAYFLKDFGRAKSRRQLFRQMEATEEWAENNYYELPIEAQLAGLVTENAFWNDYAARDPKQPFTSRHLVYPTRNFAEMMLALAVLDLPFKPYEHLVKRDKQGLKLTAGGQVVVYHKEILPADPADPAIPMLVTQNYFRLDDRYRHVGNQRYDKFVSGDFLTKVIYGGQIVLTNPNPGEQKLNLLLQVPEGAIPVAQPWVTKGQDLRVGPYATQKVEYYFYWPEPGQFGHYPVHVAREEKVVAAAKANVLHVMDKLDNRDITSWAYISQHGTGKEVLDYLGTANLNRTDLKLIAFRLKDKAFFGSTLALLQSRHVYHHLLWSYALHHDEPAAAREYLRHTPIADQVGRFIDTELLAVNPIERHRYQHLEYSPLVNPRAHRVGRAQEILNNRFRVQYQGLLGVLAFQPKLSVLDRLTVCYYQLLQDRIAEALDTFDRIDPSLLHTRLQYDYLKTYTSFYREDLAGARKLAEQYVSYPVPKWQQKFQNVLVQLDGEAKPVDKEDREQQMAELAATEPTLDFKVEAQQIDFTYQNLKGCELRFYPMDIELLFSRNPFMGKGSSRFGVIKPDLVRTVELPADQNRFSYKLPAKYAKQNVMVEARAGGIRKSHAYFANALDVQVVGNYGQVRVTRSDTRDALARTYVKVYAKMNDGKIRFWKDGYTDLRGRFDFVSLNTPHLANAQRFAVLVMHEEHGAAIQESDPPKR